MRQISVLARCRRRAAAALAIFFAAQQAACVARAGERLLADPLRVAVYDVAPHGSAGPESIFRRQRRPLAARRRGDALALSIHPGFAHGRDPRRPGTGPVRRGDRSDHHHARAVRAHRLFVSRPSLWRRSRVCAQDRAALRVVELRRRGFRTRHAARDHAPPAAVDRRADVGAGTSGVPTGARGGFGCANVARRPLLGGGHDDHGRLRR